MEYYLLLLLLIIQRLSEISQGNRNIINNKNQLIYPLDLSEKRQMLVLHSLWFLSCIFEFTWQGQVASPMIFTIGIVILIGCQFIRHQTMDLLGPYWTPFPIAFKNQKIVTNGPYRFIKHPNYLVVIIEIALIPLLGRCLWTAGIFSIINLLFLQRRMILEEKALLQIDDYQRLSMKKKLIPFIFSFLLVSVSQAETLKLEASSFEEAQKATTYFKFIGKSTKLGLVTTTFEGYAKRGVMTYEQDGTNIKNIRLKLEAKHIDTDNSSRNKKMRSQSLDVKKFKEIIVEIPQISFSSNEQIVNGYMNVRGKQIPLQINIEKKDKGIYAGSTHFKLSEAGIPDPSITIASVDDIFEIKFQVAL